MIVIYLNVRGLNSRGKQRYLQDRLKKGNPHIMLLYKTKVIGARIEEILIHMPPKYEVVALDARGSAGGVSIRWNPTKILFDN